MCIDLLYRIALVMVPGVGGITAKRLTARFGSPEAVFGAERGQLEKMLHADVAANFREGKILDAARKELAFVEANGIRALFYTDADYPHRLKQCEDSPATIFVKGNANLNAAKTIAVVGTRKASNYGVALCKKLMTELADKGYKPLVVSGLAYGIDVSAHLAAMECGFETVAVMGTPANKIYPAAHENIARRMERQGALVTEYTSGAPIIPGNFVSRNRIIAGLADVVVIVESSRKGGAMITAELAAERNRKIAAFPGRVGDEYSRGCNELIKSRKASMLESVEDLEAMMNWSAKPRCVQTIMNFGQFSERERAIVECLRNSDSEHVNFIAARTNTSISELSSVLLNLVMNGLLVELPGNRYAVKKIQDRAGNNGATVLL
ncbi:MAG: DNA-processing protein DprA [Prevotellaceae bacterium]|nr:DNA-processing protein DprA [Prevotellaceae bacterium]